MTEASEVVERVAHQLASGTEVPRGEVHVDRVQLARRVRIARRPERSEPDDAPRAAAP